jgi:glycosyltransferase involved in cell wall biosynthesis
LYFIFRIFYGPYLLAKLSNQSDIFFYIWYTGFCIDRELDYKFLKKKNKKIVCMFVGDDIRSPILTKKHFDDLGLDSFINYKDLIELLKQEQRVKKIAYLADKYADLIISSKKVQISYLSSNKIVDKFMYMISDSYLNIDKNIKHNQKLKILHAPSNPIVKGTPLVRAAIKKLQLEGFDFEYIELIDKSNEEILNLLEDSDIVLNQFYAEMPGLFGIEAMAKFNAVLMSAKYIYFSSDAQGAWLQTGYWEVYDNLKYLLDNPEKIKEYAQKGYEFVKNNFTEEKVKRFYIDIFYKYKIIDDKTVF